MFCRVVLLSHIYECSLSLYSSLKDWEAVLCPIGRFPILEPQNLAICKIIIAKKMLMEGFWSNETVKCLVGL